MTQALSTRRRRPVPRAHPYLAEIGLVGRGPGKYNLYLGAAFDGSRLNKLYRRDVGHDEIVVALTPLIERYTRNAIGSSALASS